MDNRILYEKLFYYMSLNSCPHEIVRRDSRYNMVVEWDNKRCKGLTLNCRECWRDFIKEFLLND
jgi:hypothetical protein